MVLLLVSKTVSKVDVLGVQHEREERSNPVKVWIDVYALMQRPTQ
jgi:hypothetical protein